MVSGIQRLLADTDHIVSFVSNLLFMAVVFTVIWECFLLHKKKWRASNKELLTLGISVAGATFFTYYTFFDSFEEVCIPAGGSLFEVCVYPRSVALYIGIFAAIAYVLAHTSVVYPDTKENQTFNGKNTGEVFTEGIVFLPSPGIIIKKILFLLHIPFFYGKYLSKVRKKV